MSRFIALSGALVILGVSAGNSAASSSAIRPQVGLHHPSLFGKARCPAWPGGTGLLRDGDFSSAIDPGTYNYWYRGEPFARGWRVTKRSIALVDGQTYWQAPNGVCSVDLDGNSWAGAIHTTVATTPSTGYTMTFEFSGNGDCGWEQPVRTMKVQAAGQSETLTWDTSNGNDSHHGVWLSEPFNFTATSTKTRIDFVSLDPKIKPLNKPHCGPVVAAVSVTAG
jgi:hypothetical protein